MATKSPNSWADRLRAARQRAGGLSQREAASAVGVGQRTLERWELDRIPPEYVQAEILRRLGAGVLPQTYAISQDDGGKWRWDMVDPVRKAAGRGGFARRIDAIDAAVITIRGRNLIPVLA